MDSYILFFNDILARHIYNIIYMCVYWDGGGNSHKWKRNLCSIVTERYNIIIKNSF